MTNAIACCSVWLADLLEKAGIPEHRLYWMHIMQEDGRVSKDLIKKMKFPAVFAFGQAAHTWAGPSSQLVDHPNFRWAEKTTRTYNLASLIRKELSS